MCSERTHSIGPLYVSRRGNRTLVRLAFADLQAVSRCGGLADESSVHTFRHHRADICTARNLFLQSHLNFAFFPMFLTFSLTSANIFITKMPF